MAAPKTTKLWRQKLEQVAGNVLEADERLKGWQDNLTIDGKNLEVCCIEQASWLAYYDEIAVELKYTLDFVEMIERMLRGEIMTDIKTRFQKEYTDTSIQRVIDANPDYIEVHEILLTVQEQYDKARSIVKAFEQRSYSLNNIVKIRENELEHVVVRTS